MRSANRHASTFVLTTLVVVSCASSPGDSRTAEVTTTTTTTTTTIADAVCGSLRNYVNRLVDTANSAVKNIEMSEPDVRLANVAAGFDAALLIVDDQRTVIAELDLPDSPEREALRDELLGGLDDAEAELVDERQTFDDDVEVLAAGSAQGIVGTWFNAIEKVMSVSEPEIYRYERIEFKQEFLDEPQCRNVIQQFTL